MTAPSFPFTYTDDPIFLACSYQLKRNIAKHNFPHKMAKGERQNVLDWAKNGCPGFELRQELEGSDKEKLSELYLLGPELQNLSEGAALLLNDHLFVGVNLQDHLMIQGISSGNEAKTLWKEMLELEKRLGANMEFAFHPRFGFLTANMHECGCAFQLKAYLHLPGLLNFGNISEALSHEEDVQLLNIDSMGSIAVITNPTSLGVHEDHIIHTLHGVALKLANAERSFREHLAEHTEVKDKVMRAFGLLTHSYQLELKEALDALSLIKLGLDLGLATGMESKDINPLFTAVQRGQLSSDDVGHARASYIHQALTNLVVPES